MARCEPLRGRAGGPAPAAPEHRGGPAPDGRDPGPRERRGPPGGRRGRRGRAASCSSCRGSTAATPGSGRSPGSRAPATCRPASGRWCCAAWPAPWSAWACRAAGRACGSRRSPSPRRRDPTPRTRELATEYRALVSEIATRLRAGRLSEALQGVTEPGALADTAGWWPDLSIERKVELLETLDVEARLEAVVGWARETLAELEVADKIRSEVTDGMEAQQREFLLRRQLDAINKELGDGDEDLVARVPHQARRARPARRGPGGGDPRAGPARADERPEPRARLDPQLARHAARGAVGRALHRQPRRGRGAPHPRRRPHRAERREGPHRRVPRGACPARRARADRDDRTGRGRDPGARRAARASARPRSASRSRAPWDARSRGSRSAASTTRPRSAVTGAPTSARGPAGSCGR